MVYKLGWGVTTIRALKQWLISVQFASVNMLTLLNQIQISMVKTRSNECHLYTCSSPSYILQLLFWYQIKLLNKIWRTWNADMSMLVKWQSKSLLFWKLFLKIQMNSKFDETWSIVFTIKSTSTHLKESNWATTWIWKIKIHKQVNLLLSIGDRIFFYENRIAADSFFKPLFDLGSSWSGSWSKNKVCSTPLKLQLLLKAQLHNRCRSYSSTLIKEGPR